MMLAYLDPIRSDSVAGSDAPAVSDSENPDLAAAASTDFGGLTELRPAAVIRPSTSSDVARAVRHAAADPAGRLTVAARGNGHSIHGQSLAAGGLVLEMRALGHPMALVGGPDRPACADVSGGALWEEVLAWAVGAHGMAPASWTDYLGLTVGGTLSNAGISGQAFRHGPQVANVAELEVVTGAGEIHVCSPEASPDLFFGVLGGLGQFGVITRARVKLAPAPDMVKWIRLVYGRFEDYASDAESLVTRGAESPGPDSPSYLEGFAFINDPGDPVNGHGSVPLSADSPFDSALVPPDSGPVLYCLELALHYSQDDGTVNERARGMIRPLKHIRGLEFTADVSYVGFLSRVKRAEEAARADGSWHAPHPWLNILVAASDAVDFDRKVFKRILRRGIGGPMLVYPLVRKKWDPRMSVALPEKGDIFYLVALLRFTRPPPEGPPAAELVEENRRIVECCRSNGYDFKLYLPHYETESEWAQHFGRDWPRFVERKARYDPMAVLAPGQRIFRRQ